MSPTRTANGARCLEWVSLCPHMGSAQKTLLQVLTCLTTETDPVCTIAPADLRTMIYASPVGIGQRPKTISASGLLRLLRALATLQQITRPAGTPLTFSSHANAQLRAIPIRVWRYPRHGCGCPWTADDALAIAQGRPPRFAPAASEPVHP